MIIGADKKNSHTRLEILDTLRGIAVILMLTHHLFYFLYFADVSSLDVFTLPFFVFLPKLTTALFFLVSGLSLGNAYSSPSAKVFSAKQFLKRQLTLGIGAGAISLVSHALFPHLFIYFGTLHCLLLSSCIATAFLNSKRICFFFSLAIFILYYAFNFTLTPLPTSDTLDFVPLFPYAGYLFLGIGLSSALPLIRFPRPTAQVSQKLLSFLGRHALVIYMAHYPLLLLCLKLFAKMPPLAKSALGF